MADSPYAISRTGEDVTDVPQYAMPQYGSYAVPPLSEGDAYIDEFGWAPGELRPSSVETPSGQRLRTIPLIDMRPDAVRPPEEWYGKRDADDARRHSVETVETLGWQTPSGVQPGDRRWKDNPRRDPPPESRVTSHLSPRTYGFTRLFDQFNRTRSGDPLTGSARQLNGTHFSMADHRRNYEIGGMAPVTSRRNTYRLEPQPWDVNVVDLPPEQDAMPSARVRSTDVPFPSRSWRLG